MTVEISCVVVVCFSSLKSVKKGLFCLFLGLSDLQSVVRLGRYWQGDRKAQYGDTATHPCILNNSIQSLHYKNQVTLVHVNSSAQRWKRYSDLVRSSNNAL